MHVNHVKERAKYSHYYYYIVQLHEDCDSIVNLKIFYTLSQSIISSSGGGALLFRVRFSSPYSSCQLVQKGQPVPLVCSIWLHSRITNCNGCSEDQKLEFVILDFIFFIRTPFQNPEITIFSSFEQALNNKNGCWMDEKTKRLQHLGTIQFQS